MPSCSKSNQKFIKELQEFEKLGSASYVLFMCDKYLKFAPDFLWDVLDKAYGFKHMDSIEVMESIILIIKSFAVNDEKAEYYHEDKAISLMVFCYGQIFEDFVNTEYYEDGSFEVYFAGHKIDANHIGSSAEMYNFIKKFMSKRDIAIAIWKM